MLSLPALCNRIEPLCKSVVYTQSNRNQQKIEEEEEKITNAETCEEMIENVVHWSAIQVNFNMKW